MYTFRMAAAAMIYVDVKLDQDDVEEARAKAHERFQAEAGEGYCIDSKGDLVVYYMPEHALHEEADPIKRIEVADVETAGT